MYRIVNDGMVVGICDEPRWVKLHKNGSFVQTDRENATHIAVGGTAYGLDETEVKKVDSGEIVFEQGKEVSEASAGVLEAQDALCEVSADVFSRIADIEDALCEISKV